MWEVWKGRKEQWKQVVVKVMNQEQASMQVGPEQQPARSGHAGHMTWHDELPDCAAERRQRLWGSDKIRASSGHMLTIALWYGMRALQQSCGRCSVI